MSDFVQTLSCYFSQAPRLLFGILAVDADRNDDWAYIKYGCYQCHGYLGQGALLSGPRIVPSELPLEAFTEIIRRPYGVMPPYSPDVLDQKTLENIYRHLQSIKAEASGN